MTKDEALEIALHALANCRDFISSCESSTPPWDSIQQYDECQDAIKAIKTALGAAT